MGATGVAQICDVVLQSAAKPASGRSRNHSLGLAQNLGGSGATCVVTILGRVMSEHDRNRIYRNGGVLAPEASSTTCPTRRPSSTLDDGGRVTGRILGERVAIGDRVVAGGRRATESRIFTKAINHETGRTDEPHRGRDRLRSAGAARALEARAAASSTWRSASPISPRRRTSSKRQRQALDEGWTHYGPTQGLPELREAIAAYVARTRGIRVGPEHVSVVPGGKPIIFFPMLALLEPGDEVIYPNPGFPDLRIDDQFPRRDAGADAADGRAAASPSTSTCSATA